MSEWPTTLTPTCTLPDLLVCRPERAQPLLGAIAGLLRQV